ncbi:MAG: nucleotidyltransferase domain-containing protein [Candidatus Omnitrophica bacterium]|nr:nucleotidyltransferase domain-containing protein [Candidatus Omnitrophota bacterium]
MIDVAPCYMEIIQDILEKYILNWEVRAFGSRVNGTAKEYSDLDLVIVGKEKLPKKTLYILREEFQESDLPFRVEIMDWQTISDEFKKIIEQGYEVVK